MDVLASDVNTSMSLQCLTAEAVRPFPSSVVRRRGCKKQPVLYLV